MGTLETAYGLKSSMRFLGVSSHVRVCSFCFFPVRRMSPFFGCLGRVPKDVLGAETPRACGGTA